MKEFLDKDFILKTETAKELYHEFAEKQPIIDYHCHLSPQMVAENKRFESIAQIWLQGDHYKWRAMRSNGIDERRITGDATDWEKFEAWADTMPYCLRNPLYHWSHLELKTAFGITERLNPETASSIYKECNRQIEEDDKFCPQGLMKFYGVEVVCTTDDPADDLKWHKMAREKEGSTRMLPAWRPDVAMNIDAPAWKEYIEKLSKISDTDIHDFDSLTDALKKRHDFFAEIGCRLSDHGPEEFYDDPCTPQQANEIVAKALSGKALTTAETRQFKHAFLRQQARMDGESGWTQQYHFGAMRNNNTRMFKNIGVDTGFDSIGECMTAQALSNFLDEINSEGLLAKTILYNLNPSANEMLATMIGNFQDGSTPGKIQWGSGWWFLDQKDGMERQMNTLSVLGLLSRFVGMLTDSRSFLSYPRHEYFRRTLCNLLGDDIENGLLPYTGYERTRIQEMVKDICYRNAKEFFNF